MQQATMRRPSWMKRAQVRVGNLLTMIRSGYNPTAPEVEKAIKDFRIFRRHQRRVRRSVLARRIARKRMAAESRRINRGKRMG